MLTNEKIKSVIDFTIGDSNFITDITKFELTSKPLKKERITFRKHKEGSAVEWKLKIGAVWDGGSADSLHDFLWIYAGSKVPFQIRPFEDFHPARHRFFYGIVRLPSKPPIKVQAGKISTYNYTFEVVDAPMRADSINGLLTDTYYDRY